MQPSVRMGDDWNDGWSGEKPTRLKLSGFGAQPRDCASMFIMATEEQVTHERLFRENADIKLIVCCTGDRNRDLEFLYVVFENCLHENIVSTYVF